MKLGFVNGLLKLVSSQARHVCSCLLLAESYCAEHRALFIIRPRW